jgi:hypothetical protein
VLLFQSWKTEILGMLICFISQTLQAEPPKLRTKNKSSVERDLCATRGRCPDKITCIEAAAPDNNTCITDLEKSQHSISSQDNISSQVISFGSFPLVRGITVGLALRACYLKSQPIVPSESHLIIDCLE